MSLSNDTTKRAPSERDLEHAVFNYKFPITWSKNTTEGLLLQLLDSLIGNQPLDVAEGNGPNSTLASVSSHDGGPPVRLQSKTARFKMQGDRVEPAVQPQGCVQYLASLNEFFPVQFEMFDHTIWILEDQRKAFALAYSPLNQLSARTVRTRKFDADVQLGEDHFASWNCE